jgi:ubiquinone/menaquinone biosynthesis C-methylase UbiE
MELKHQQVRYAEELASRVRSDEAWLDLGCGHQFFPAWANSKVTDPEALAKHPRLLVGLDGDDASLRRHAQIVNRVRGDVEHLPFRDNSFTLVSANMVLEHVSNPLATLREVRRALAPGGIFLFHTTNRLFYQIAIASILPQRVKNAIIYALERRTSDDVYPTAYKINTPWKLRDIVKKSGLKLVELRMLSPPGALALLGPLVIFELLITRILETPIFRNFRANMIVILQKDA